MQRYYQVTDFDGNSTYYGNLLSAKKAAKMLKKEMVDGNWGGSVDITIFTLPKIPKRELNLCLLNNSGFMSDRKEITYFSREIS